LAAGGLAALEAIINHLGVGWCFTLFAALCSTAIPILLAERRWGMGWRLARDSKASGKEKKASDQRRRGESKKTKTECAGTEEEGAKIAGTQRMEGESEKGHTTAVDGEV